MTKKKLKKLAQHMAECEKIIQQNENSSCPDRVAINEAQNELTKLTMSSSLTLDDLIDLDVEISKILEKENF